MVLVTGRPLTLTWEDDEMDAILNVWSPGSEGGHAIADVLFVVPGDNGVDIGPFPRKGVTDGAGGTARTSVQIQEHRIVQVFPVNIDPLAGAIDIDIHLFVDAALRRGRVDSLSHKPDQEKQGDQRKQHDGEPFQDSQEKGRAFFHHSSELLQVSFPVTTHTNITILPGF